ncbi:hypothetical protein [Rhodoferax sp. WC2427]|uniref:hypothetical protein n=1 Tax=Rhodoferax sp. WC2427 TaxID=3234144 RepID=UPI003466067A
MAEPTISAAATFVAVGAAIPVLTAFGVPLGLRADVLLAGFLGAGAAMVLLNTVPSSGDTLPNLLATTVRRGFVAVASSLTAGYMVPVFAENSAIASQLFYSFLIGAGAQKILSVAVERFAGRVEGKP